MVRIEKCAALLVSLILGCSHVVLADEVPADDVLAVSHIMNDDPHLELPGFQWVYAPELKPLWLAALNRDDSELQRLAADTFALAHRQGMPELQSVTTDLLRVLDKPETISTVRRAAAHALVALEAKDHASHLAEAAKKYGLDIQSVVEPALADWQSEALRDEWRRRLADSETPPRLLALAIEGSAKLKDAEAQPALLSIVLNKQMPNHKRYSAAAALSEIGKGGMADAAQGLLADKSNAGIAERLLAVQLLSADKSDESLDALCELAKDPEPAVVGAALKRVLEIEPARLFPLAPAAVKHADVNVRRAGAQALLIQGTLESLDVVAPLLDDRNPSLRRHVAKGLFDHAEKSELRPRVIEIVEKGLASESWRTLEQASLLVGYLDHKPFAPRLVELLKHGRSEVSISSAWALRALKVSETYPAILAHAVAQHQRHLSPETPMYLRPALYAQMAQLFQLFGEAKLKEADPLLRQYVPKVIGLGDSRPAACWALGRIHEGNAPADLAEQFAERLADVNSMPTEIDEVRFMCAIALGRMKAQAQLPVLERFTREGTRVSLACYWAIEALTGEKTPPFEPYRFQVQGWFLQPFDQKK